MSMILSSLIIIPLIGAIIALFMGGSREKLSKYVAIAFSAITLVVSLLLLLGIFGDFEDLSESFEWIHNSSFIMNYALTVDGLSILMVFLTALLVLLVNIFSLDEHRENNNYFYALIMAMEVGLMGVYLASDYFLFYIMWEVTLIPMYFMISWYGGPRRHYSAIKFFIYTHVASLVMLIGFFVIGYESVAPGEVVNFSFEAVKNGIASAALGIQSLIFALLFFGFMVKMPSVPFHTWLPDAHTEAPTEGSVLLAGVMLKMGSYGIIRICVEALPDAAAYWLFDEKVLTKENVKEYEILGQIFGTYWIIAFKDKMFLVDQHAAHEKVNYERMLKRYKNGEMLSQMVNPPVIVALTSAEEELFLNYRQYFEKLGFNIENFGGREYAMRAIPIDLFGCESEKDMFIQILDELSHESGLDRTPDVINYKIASMACKASVKGNTRMSRAEMEALLDELLTLDNPYNCPHGRPTIISMSKYEIDKKFKRVVE